MVQEEFGDFKYMSKQTPNLVKAVDRQSIRFMDIRMYAVRKGDPLVTIYYNLNDPSVQMNLFQSGTETFEMDLQMNPMLAYSRLTQISTKT